jgi:hypothetical protein
MINVNQITSRLASMPDQALQQYAAMHKNDPYVMALALSESNRRKQMRQGAQMQAPQQPKVVDQEIAQMSQPMPEDTGIGQLPAPNMQNMAEGGIVAFEGGGEVSRFQAGGGVPPGAIIMGNMYQDPVTGQMKPLPQQDALPFGNVPMNYAENKRLYEAKKQADLAARKTSAQSVLNENPEAYAARKVAELEAQGGKKLTPDARNIAMSQFVKEKIAGQVGRGEASFTSSGQLPAPATTYTGEKPLPGITPPGLTALKPDAAKPSADDEYLSGLNKLAGSNQVASTMGPITKLDAKRYAFTPAEMAEIKPADFVKALESAMPKDPTASPFDAQQKALNEANTATRQNAKAEMEKQFEKQGLAFTDTLNKLTSKEKRVQTMEDNQLGVSMFEAGLAMMAGESPHAMVNIGKGAQVGTKKYAEIQDKVEGARDKIDEMKMKIEEFRRNEANMNSRELRAAQRDIDDSVSAGAQSMIALAREQYGLNKQQAISFVSNSMQMQQFNVGEKNRAAAQNQQTAANIDTAYAQMANQASIAEKARSTQLGIAGLEAKYRKNNPQAGSLGFFREIGKGDPVKGMEIYSRSLGPEAKGDEAMIANYMKNPTALMALEATDPDLAKYIKQKIKMQMVQPVNLPANAPMLP